MSIELLAVSSGKLVGASIARATAHRARLRVDSRGGDHRRSDWNTFDSLSRVAWSGVGHRERDADDSESRTFWLFDSASVHRRHRHAHRARRARPLFAFADHSQHGNWNTQR